jgi:hypothetical protein
MLARGALWPEGASDPTQFSWKSVAASAVGAGVGQAVGEAVLGQSGSEAFPRFDDSGNLMPGASAFDGGRYFASDAANSMGLLGSRITGAALSGIGASTATAVMRGGKVSIQQVGIDAFGNALGTGIAYANYGGGGQQAPVQSEDYAAAQRQGQPYYDQIVDVFSGDSGVTQLAGDPLADRWGAETDPNRITSDASRGMGAALPPEPYTGQGLKLPAGYANPFGLRSTAQSSGGYGAAMVAQDQYNAMGEYTGTIMAPAQGQSMMPYAQSVGNALSGTAQLGYGAVKGLVVNGVAEMAVSAVKGWAYIGASLRDGYDGITGAALGNYLDRSISAGDNYSGQVWSYDNSLQRLGGYAGEFVSPFVAGKVVSAGSDLYSLTRAAGGVTESWAAGQAERVALTTMEREAWIPSSQIRVTQQSVSFAKRDELGSIRYTLDDVASGFAKNPSDDRLVIDVVRMRDGGYASVDNSRPTVVNIGGGAEMRVRLQGADDLLTASQADRFTVYPRGGNPVSPTTWGQAAELRIGEQSRTFSTTYPFGMIGIPKVSGAPAGSIWSTYSKLPWSR